MKRQAYQKGYTTQGKNLDPQKRQMHALMYTGEGRQERLLAVANKPAVLLTPAPANTTSHTWLDCCSLLGRHTQVIPGVTLRRIPCQHLAAPRSSIMQPKEAYHGDHIRLMHGWWETDCIPQGQPQSAVPGVNDHKSMACQQQHTSRQSYTSGCLIKGTWCTVHCHSTASLQHSHNLRNPSA
jgi:hypothetical protein